jgi:guanylate kinase
MRLGFPLILSAPSGTGKSTICRKLLQRDRSLRYSVSCTTRQPRSGEKNGKDYHFLSVEEFKRGIHRNEFLEWVQVYDHYYGTPRKFVEEKIAAGHVVLLAIEVQGANAVRKRLPSVTVFVVPPSWSSLEERLNHRSQNSIDDVHKRLSNASAELHEARHYDYLVVNDELKQAVENVEAIITAEKLRTSRQDLSRFSLALGGHKS